MATWPGPATSVSRMISVPKSARDRLVRPTGQAPIRPPAEATAATCAGGQQPRVGGAGVGELAVGDDHRLVRCLQHGHGGIEAGVGAVDHDAQLVALGDHGPAEPAQPAVHRWFGLHVADLVGPVVHQGQHGDAVRAGLLQPPQVALEEVTALAAEQHHGAPVGRGPVHPGR